MSCSQQEKKQANIALVVAAYNRPAALQRLLQSVAMADYKGYGSIELIISIDFSGSNTCRQVAESFDWKYGKKSVLQHKKRLGLKDHILFCGDQVQRFDGAIVLEDDLFVARYFYHYSQQAYFFYKDDEKIAGIALYNNTFNEVALCPFQPIHDGWDTYFMQVPCSWGQLWTAKQWTNFRTYSNVEKEEIFNQLPKNVQKWPTSSSWKKLFYAYLLDSRKYFVYPRISLTTNFGEPGEHLVQSQSAFQSPLLLSEKKFLFHNLANSTSIYDGYYELEEHTLKNILKDYDSVTVDLNGTKPLHTVRTKYLLSSKKCNAVQKKYAVSCYPYEINILLGINETGYSSAFFSLGEAKDFCDEKQFDRLLIDVNRTFLGTTFIIQSFRNACQRSKEFRIGTALLRPFRILRKIIGQRDL